ncbi:hypothetical protein ACJX0J_042337, partial [Zea mays]
MSGSITTSLSTTGKLSSVGSSFMASAGSRSTSGGFDVLENRILEAPNLRTFTFIELKTATKNFRPDSVLGWVDEKTMAPTRNDTGMVVAVKKLNSDSMQGFQEWQFSTNAVYDRKLSGRQPFDSAKLDSVGDDAILNGSHVVDFTDDGSKVTAILEDDRIFELPYWRTVEYLKVRKTLFGHSDATYSGYTCYTGIADFVPPDIDTVGYDASWKVRRASSKCLSAIIVSRPEMLVKMFLEACPKLIERFREREENVKIDIFNTFIELLRQTGNVTKGQGDIDESSPRWLLKQEVPKVVKSINRQLREKSIKTKVVAFSVLKDLVVVLPGCLADHFGSLVPGIEKSLNSSTSNLKIEVLVLTRLVMASHSPSVFHPYIKALSAPILSAIKDRYYKVTAEALRVCGELVRVLRPNLEKTAVDFKPYIGPIYNAILGRLANQDQDQCNLIYHANLCSPKGELPACLPILVDRMGNEITRLTDVKAFSVIANSPLRIDLSCVLDHVVSELTAFLRKANRALRQATLEIVTYGLQY